MGRFTAVALLLAQLIAISLACSSGGGGGGRGGGGGHPWGVDLSRNTQFYPEYNPQLGTVGVGLEHRFSPNLGINVRPGVDPRGILIGKRRPQGDVELQYHFKRSIENEKAHDIDMSRKVFEALDINGDDQLDVKEWFDEGGKVRSFSDMIGDHDDNSDERISLEEFLTIPVDPALIAAIDQMMGNDQN